MSPNLGPLTTYWTPPSSCLSTITSCSDWNGHLWLGMTGNLVVPGCFPTNFATDNVYSPGICPSGWTSACTPYVSNSPIFPTTISAIQCCPLSFSCDYRDGNGFDMCISTPPPTPISVLAIPPATAIDHGNPSTISGSWVYSNFQNDLVQVKPIFVAYQSTDTEILDLLTPTLRPSSSSMTMSLPNTVTVNPTFASPTSTSMEMSPPSGLSQAGKIAIGVIVPLAVIALVAALSLFFYRKSQILAPTEVENVQVQWEKSELPAHSQLAHPLAQTSSARAELEEARAPPHELQ